jgi:hypothetical protein
MQYSKVLIYDVYMTLCESDLLNLKLLLLSDFAMKGQIRIFIDLEGDLSSWVSKNQMFQHVCMIESR